MRELVLPWPSRDLHPNSRVHWTRKSRASQYSKDLACVLAIEAGWKNHGMPEGRIHIWIDGYPTDRRRRDADGLLSSLKAALDGIALAMQIDDQRFVPHPWVKDEVRKDGEVRIRITSSPSVAVGLG